MNCFDRYTGTPFAVFEVDGYYRNGAIMREIRFPLFRTSIAIFACLIAVLGHAETIVFGHILDDSTAHHQGILWAAKQLESQLGGRYQLQVFARGQLGKTDAEVVEGFKYGTANMAYLSFGHLLNIYPPLAIGAGPYVFRDFDHWQAFRDSALFQELVTDMEKKTGLKTFGLAYYGERQVTTNTPLHTLDDFKGLVIRVPNIPTMILTFRALGARSVPIPFKETYQALKTKIVDAQENPLPTIRAMHFYEVSPVVNLTSHILDAQLIVMDAKYWNGLPAEDRPVLARIFGEVAQRVTQDVRQEELALRQTMSEQGVTFNEVDRAALAAALRPFHHSDYFPWGGDLYDRIQALH